MNAVEPFPIVGIGASAGGLRALEDFFRTIPANPGMAFVIVTHLAPDRHSFLTEILARHTGLAVESARDGQKVEPNRVYVLPPAASLTLAGGQLALRELAPDQHERNPVDVFFASLAQDCGEYAVGIVLSGSGHDGVLGVKAIKEHAGLVLAQAGDGSGPGFADMPDSAIASGLVDFAVPVEDMAAKLLENARGFATLDDLSEHRLIAGGERDARDAGKQMQSSDEELESTKEELQSLNEELQTVNHELYAKIGELDRANADLTNLFASTNVATIFLDRNLAIRSFTPAVGQLFHVVDTDRGRPLGDLAIALDYPELQADIARVLATGTPIERPTHGNDAAAPYFLARLTPYCDSIGAIDGVVANFVDVTGLAKSEQRQRALVSELNHRVKNMLMVVMAIAQQTLTRAISSEEFKLGFFARLQALARSHDLLSQENWGEVEVELALRQALEPFLQPGRERIAFAGPVVAIPPPLALSLGTIIGELAMNAVKFGALSNETGRIAIGWFKQTGEGHEAPVLTLTWRESGGPPVAPPLRTGFGLKVIEREVEYSNSGTARFDFAPSGLSARFELRLPPAQNVQLGGADAGIVYS